MWIGRYPGGVIELDLTGVAHGGEAVGRLEGKACFVDGAMPGERVRGEVVKDGGTWARVDLREVVTASPQRVEPPCPLFGACGGCQWQFADYPAQLEWKRQILAGQLEHLGRVEDPPVRETVAAGAPFRYRNRVTSRWKPAGPPSPGGAATPPARRRLPPAPPGAGRPGGSSGRPGEGDGPHPASGDGFRGPAGGGRRARPAPGVGLGLRCGTAAAGPPGPAGGPGLHRRDGGRGGLRISGDAFFQNNTPGAEALVGLVAEALAPRPDETLLDAYAGGGLFGLTVGRGTAGVLAVESDPVAVDDLRHNAEASPMPVRVVEGAVEQAPSPRGPLGPGGGRSAAQRVGERGVGAVVIGRPRAIAYVACDPASLARDTRTLVDAGYRLDWVAPVDLFPPDLPRGGGRRLRRPLRRPAARSVRTDCRRTRTPSPWRSRPRSPTGTWSRSRRRSAPGRSCA